MGYLIDKNAKNVWVRDHADTMDLPVQTDANSVYFNNGRTMEQEFGKGTMSSNVVTVDSGMEKVIDGTYDGAYESLVFKGKSLVNLLNYSFPSRTDWYDNAGANSYIRTGQSINMLKPNTDYLMWFEGETTIVQILALSTVFTKAYFELTGKSLVKVRTVNGELPANFTIHFKSSIGGSLTDNEKASVKLMLIEYIEGMENWDIPYFEGLCDVKMPILHTVGKNLLNDSTSVSGWISDSGAITVHGDLGVRDNYLSDYIYTGGMQYIKSNSPVWVWKFDKNKNFISRYSNGTVDIDVSDCVYIRIGRSCNANVALSLIGAMQLEFGTQSTSYEPYKTNILRTSEEVVLREVNGVQDTYNPLTGEYVKRIGEVVITSAVAKSVVVLDKNVRVNIAMSALNGDNGTTKANNTLSDKFYWSEANARDIEGLRVNGNTLHWCISRDKLTSQDLQGVNTWLQSNPITVQYILAEPVTTIVKPSTMTPFAYQNGHVLLESGSIEQSLLPTLEYQTVVSRSGQVAMIDKTIQQHERKITLLEKMLVQNIIDIEYKNTLLALKLEINEVI